TNTNLVIVGRLGWRSSELEARIRRHAQYGRRLHWLENASDSDLDYAYRHASALIFLSRCEGFGLPLVEAMRYGLPVFASDIPVFREVGGDYPTYIAPDDKIMLLDTIGSFEETLAATANVPRATGKWLSWTESARML